MDLRESLLAAVESFLARTGMTPTALGRLAVNDGNFIARLRHGRGPTTRTYARVEAFMASHAPPGAAAGTQPSPELAHIIRALRAHRADLNAQGIAHVAVFGSVARGEARATSDVDLLIEIAPGRRVGLFGLSRLKRRLAEIIPRADVVDKRSLHPAIVGAVATDAVYAF